MRLPQNAWSLCLFISFACSTSFILSQEAGPPQQADSQSQTSHASSEPAANSTPGVPRTPPSSPLKSPEPVTADPNHERPASIFDALETRLTAPVTLVEVHATGRESFGSEPFRAGGQEILSAAGSYGDIERFLQVIPGVTMTNDLSNEVMVRGGHPMENLFVVDGIEVPNINHIAM